MNPDEKKPEYTEEEEGIIRAVEFEMTPQAAVAKRIRDMSAGLVADLMKKKEKVVPLAGGDHYRRKQRPEAERRAAHRYL